MSTEDELYYPINYMYPIRDRANPYLGKTGRIAS
jgi:CHASE1-domain containing sensor protein